MDAPISKGNFASRHKTSIASEKKDHYNPSQRKVDLIAKIFGYNVLRLPSYRCILNPVEMFWNQLKTHAC